MEFIGWAGSILALIAGFLGYALAALLCGKDRGLSKP